ncbi:MAG: iron-containing alcohol dehydrogenase [Planctomycetaceae bacterium]|nr:iron-containing alcohol dehydrogenase [Planctomycetaceae bacterium]
MQNFVYRNATEIIFGKGTIAEVETRVPRDVPIMLTYGGGSIKKNGVYEQVQAALKGREVIEFAGIEPNPLYETCLKAVDLLRNGRVGFLLAVGGGSVIDATKFIAAAACYEGPDPWDILRSGGQQVKAAIPLGTVLTLPATGTESNGNSVISRKATAEKLAFYAGCVFPVFSVLDPETTYTLPLKQVRNGVVDAFVHVMEQYMTYPAEAPLQDRLAESILQTLIEVGPRTLAQPRDYESRASFMWSATLALNTLIGCGVPQDWSTHMIGHELTALYGPAHAETLAIVLPGVWVHQLAKKEAKLRQYGQRVWGVAAAEAAIQKTEEFFHSLDMPTRLNAYNINAEEAAEAVRRRFTERGVKFGEQGDIDGDAAAAILRSRA